MTLLEIWDSISGVSDAVPFDCGFADQVSSLLRHSKKRHTRVLDVGGGAGNPSIGLAKGGCDVHLVDVDPTFVAAARRRSAAANAQLAVTGENWRDFLAKRRHTECFDAVLCLGNALGYQDTWPDGTLPKTDVVSALASSFRLFRSVLAAGGL